MVPHHRDALLGNAGQLPLGKERTVGFHRAKFVVAVINRIKHFIVHIKVQARQVAAPGHRSDCRYVGNRCAGRTRHDRQPEGIYLPVVLQSGIEQTAFCITCIGNERQRFETAIVQARHPCRQIEGPRNQTRCEIELHDTVGLLDAHVDKIAAGIGYTNAFQVNRKTPALHRRSVSIHVGHHTVVVDDKQFFETRVPDNTAGFEAGEQSAADLHAGQRGGRENISRETDGTQLDQDRHAYQ